MNFASLRLLRTTETSFQLLSLTSRDLLRNGLPDTLGCETTLIYRFADTGSSKWQT